MVFFNVCVFFFFIPSQIPKSDRQLSSSNSVVLEPKEENCAEAVKKPKELEKIPIADGR